jgi:hypothetical protein
MSGMGSSFGRLVSFFFRRFNFVQYVFRFNLLDEIFQLIVVTSFDVTPIGNCFYQAERSG